MPVKIKSMETAPNGTVSVRLSFPDTELDQFLRWYASGNGVKQTGTRRKGTTRRKVKASPKQLANLRKARLALKRKREAAAS